MTINVLIGNGSWYPAAGGDPPVITIPTSLPTVPANTVYTSTQFYASGTAPITWSNTGSLPSGMTFSSSGLLSGTPTAAANSSITFTATNSYGSNNSALTLTVNTAGSGPAAITRFTLPGGTVGTPYSQQITATGAAPITFSVQDGVLPTGLSLDSSTGIISGTPSVGSSTQFIIQAVNGISQPNTEVKFVGYAVKVSPFVVAPYVIQNAIPDCHTTIPYSQTFTSTGDGPFVWSMTGSLPTGLNWDATTATISGTPTATASNTSITITATNSSGSNSKTITFNSVAYSSNRLYKTDLTWAGAFRLPITGYYPYYEAYQSGLPSITVVPSQTVFYMGVARNGSAQATGLPAAKLSLPVVVNSTVKANLNTATFLSSPIYYDTSEGQYTSIPNGNINGIFWNNNKLYITAAYFYETTNNVPTIYSRPDTFTSSTISGPAKINNTSRQYSFGFDVTAPSAVSGGINDLAVGGSAGSIVSTLSRGPSLFAFNDSSLTTGTTNLTGQNLLAYDSDARALCQLYGFTFHQQNPWYQLGVSSINGFAWIQNKPVVLFFGTHGIGQSWYGALNTGGAFIEEPSILSNVPGQVATNAGNAKGNQVYPYVPYVWAYDQQDLIDVKNGTKQYYQIKPYDVWTLDFPSQYLPDFKGGTGGMVGVASHDPAAKRIYVALRDSDMVRLGFQDLYFPMIHVFSYP